MPRTTIMSPALVALLRQQNGVASLRQLAAESFGRSAVQHRIGKGIWRWLLPGVVLTRAGDPNRRQLLLAAILWAGPGAAVDAGDACVWHGLRPEGFRPDLVHIVVPEESVARTRSFVVVRRSAAEIAVGQHGLVPYVDIATAVITAAREAPSVPTAVSLLSRALQKRLVTLSSLAAAREQIGDKWCRRVDGALAAVGVGLRSPAEKDAHDLIVSSLVLPEPLWNQWLDLGDGGCAVCVDALWKDAGMVNEVLGKKWHAWGEQFESTEARRARLVAAGLVAQGCTAIQLRQAKALVLDKLERTYVLNAGRGMPAGVQLIDPPSPIAV